MDFGGKTILITGASRGIGATCARRFAQEGARLILTARSRQPLEDLAAQIAPVETAVFPADLCNESSLNRLCSDIRGRFDRIDVLINNAGAGLYAPVMEAAPELVTQLFKLNYLAPAELIRQLGPLIPEGGSVVNVSSIAGKVPLPWMTHYSATKYALNALSDGLHMEFSPRGVHVLSVCPGMVETNFGQNVLQGTIPESASRSRRFKITADECVDALIRGIRKRNRMVVIPKIGWLLVLVVRLFPGMVFGRIARLLPAQPMANSTRS